MVKKKARTTEEILAEIDAEMDAEEVFVGANEVLDYVALWGIKGDKERVYVARFKTEEERNDFVGGVRTKKKIRGKRISTVRLYNVPQNFNSIPRGGPRMKSLREEDYVEGGLKVPRSKTLIETLRQYSYLKKRACAVDETVGVDDGGPRVYRNITEGGVDDRPDIPNGF